MGSFALDKVLSAPPPDSREIIDRFHQIWYDSKVWEKLAWFGIPIQKNPFDLFQYQEVLFEEKPDFVIETGALYGGATLFFAQIFGAIGKGEVISIDTNPRWDFRVRDHPRVATYTGSSIDRRIVAAIAKRIAGRPVMVVLDSNHSKEHVLQELRLYGKLLQPGGLLVVEDTDINGHPVYPRHGPGPYEAVEAFLGERNDFAIDEARERKMLFTSAPRGWLRKKPLKEKARDAVKRQRFSHLRSR